MSFREGLLAAAGAIALTAAFAAPSFAQDQKPAMEDSADKAAPSAADKGGITDKMLIDDAKTPGDVLTYGMGPEAHRFSDIKKINKQNIKGLIPAWSFSFGGEKQRGQESQALVTRRRHLCDRLL